ncbi:hypothetical protein [Anaerosinus massiliensis]|uniref:hypothetical protein n=1 Tax=Massilibacillus massiliensis TaxID=1806837 RepID=UPI000A74DBA4|nr:hypothetical protein [Massilibacillus massiliensis]
MFDRLWKGTTKITKLESYSVNSPWKNNAVLLHVTNGLGHLRMVYGMTKSNKQKIFMLLKDIPLVKWHCIDEYNCPTCEKLISAGYGLNSINEEVISEIRSCMNQSYKTIDLAVDNLVPILKLLSSGYYVVVDLPLYPADGNGQFFWNQSNQPAFNKGTCSIYYKQMYSQGRPAFILPSQLPESYDAATMNRYQEMYRAGESLRGLAYYMGDYLCTLLDGHHKAVAAALEGQEFRCLTILPVHGVSCLKDEKNFKMSIGSQWIDSKNLPTKFNKDFKKLYGQDNKLKTNEVEKYLTMEAECWEQFKWPQELLDIGKQYPDAFTLACIDFSGDLSDERIYRLLLNEEVDSEDKLEFIFKSLVGLKDIRATELAMKIAKDEGLKNLWQEVFEYLATVQSEQIEDFFIDFLVNDEKLRPKLTKIADNYLMKRSGNC